MIGPLLVTLTVTLVSGAYAAIAGATWALLDLHEQPDARALLAALWPISLPALLGARLVAYLRRPRISIPTATARTKERFT